MAGHSKWNNIKRKKGAADARKGKVFTKLVREITTAARLGGGDPNANPRLRAAIAVAKAERMPADNIERAIKKGTGALEGPPVEETLYEGYGPGGIAILVEAQTDNRNRTTAEVRAAFAKLGGSLGAAGSVAWMFQKRGIFSFAAAQVSEEQAFEAAVEVGARDVRVEGEAVIVECEAQDFAQMMDAFDRRQYTYEDAELTMLPDNTVAITGEEALKILRLVERLEDLDDVQKVYASADISEEALQAWSNES